ncbi:MAG TPA: glycosyltransferase [Solirubrobacteraceae bacterium]|jgi:glycosyltransferase involved in cell wall biosynthesis
MRLGIYIDAMYRVEEDGTVLTNFETLPFLRFGSEVGRHFDELVLFGRAAPEGVGVDYALPSGARVAPLPWYPSLAHLGDFLRAVTRIVPALWRGLDRVDVVWAFGPHPISLVLAFLALVRRRRVVLGVRQDTMPYFRTRLRGRGTAPLLAPLWVLDALWRAVSRAVPAAVVGPELERRYRGPRPGLLPMTVSLMREEDIAADVRPAPGEQVELLTVGRVEPEKNPLLLVDALADLIAEGDRRWRLTWIGTGRLTDAVRERARERGIADAVDLLGFVPPGEGLLARYRAADVFVHVALTEGVPQVLLEALATATPVVATDVGGVSFALDGGRAGALVPPRDRQALVEAVRAVVADDEARTTRTRRGLELARERTLEAESRRVAAFLRAGSTALR